MKSATERTGWKIAIIYGLGVMAAMSVSEAVPVLGKIAGEFRPHNPSMIGLIMSLPSLVVALGALLAGGFVDRIGDRPVLFAGALTVIAGDIFVTAAPSLQLLLAARLLTGVGYVLMAVSAVTLLVRVAAAGRQRTMALALWSTFVPVSFILPFITARLVAASGNWRTAFIGHLTVTAVFLAIGYMILPRRDRAVVGITPSRTQGLGSVLRTPWPYLLGLSFGAAAFLQSGVFASFGPYLATHYHVSPVSVDGWSAGALAINALGCLAVGQLLNRGVAAPVIGGVAIVLTGVPAYLIYALPLGFSGSIGASWIFGFGTGLLAGMWALLPSVAPSPASLGATSGLVTQITLLGVLLGAPLCFAVQAAAGPAPMLILISAGLLACLAGAPVWLRAGRFQILTASRPTAAGVVKG